MFIIVWYHFINSSFNAHNVYNHKDREPIANDTVLVLDPLDGRIIKSWGSKRWLNLTITQNEKSYSCLITELHALQIFYTSWNQYWSAGKYLAHRPCTPSSISIQTRSVKRTWSCVRRTFRSWRWFETLLQTNGKNLDPIEKQYII